VVNVHDFGVCNALPARSFASVLIVAIYFVAESKSFIGSKIVVLPSELRVTVPSMLMVVPSFFTVNVFLLIVEVSIGPPNVAVTGEVTATPFSPSAGVVPTTVGDVLSVACPLALVSAFSAADSAPQKRIHIC